MNCYRVGQVMGEITASIFRVDKEEEAARTGMSNGGGGGGCEIGA